MDNRQQIFPYKIYFLEIFEFITENTALHFFEMFSCRIALIHLPVFVLNLFFQSHLTLGNLLKL